MPNPITLNIDPNSLREAAGTDRVVEVLERVEAMLDRIEQRMGGDDRLSVDGKEAARLTGICERTLQTHGCPSVQIGSRRVYRIDAIKEWLAAQERQEAAV